MGLAPAGPPSRTMGAALAGKFVTLQKVDRTLPAGVLIGIAVCLLAGTTSIPVAFAIVTITGACGGFFVIPLNALLQERATTASARETPSPCRDCARTARSC